LLPRPGQNEFQHHIVGQQNVRRLGDDPVPRLVIFLAGVALEADRPLQIRKSLVKELVQLIELAVGQSVHGIHNNGPDPLSWSIMENPVHNGDDVGQALP